MEKKRTLLLTLVTGLFLMGFISAYSTSGIFSLTGILDSLDPANIFLGGIFLIAFAMLNMVLSKVFKDNAGQPNTTVAGVVAFVLSVFIIYGLNRTGFDIQGFFFDLGISSDTLYPIVAIVLIAGSIFVIAQYGLRSLLAILGGFFIIASFFVYEAEAMLILGIFFEVFAFMLWAWNKKKARNSGDFETLKGAGRWGAKKTWGGMKRTGRVLKKGAKKADEYAGRRYDKKQGEQARKEKDALIGEELAEIKRREQARKEDARQDQSQEQEKTDKVQQKQIGTNLKSLTKTYKEINRQNPNDPRLSSLAKEIKRLRKLR